MSSVVNCAAYQKGQRVRDVCLEDVSEVLKDDGPFVWIGIHDPTEELLRQVQEEFQLHELAVEDALRGHQRPKVEEYGSSLFVVLRTVFRQDGELAVGETHIFVGPRYIVSLRHGASPSYAPVRARCEASPQGLGKGPAFVLYALLDFVVDGFFPVIEDLEEEVEALEDAVFTGTVKRETTQRIYHLKSDLLSVKRAVSPLIDVCNRLMRFDMGIVTDDVRLYLRDVYDHVIRINEAVDNQRELLTSALEANLSLISVRQNEIMKRLGAWAAIIAVPTMIAGVYGMNFSHMPELGWTYGYPLSLAAMLGACGTLYAIFKRDGWL